MGAFSPSELWEKKGNSQKWLEKVGRSYAFWKFFSPENYPDLDVEFLDGGHLNVVDYVYVYTVLLYYPYLVKQPTFLPKILELNEKFQNSINKLCESLLNEESINRDAIRRAIASAVPAKRQMQFFESLDIQQPPTPTKIIRAKNIEIEETETAFGKIITDLKAEKERIENDLRKKLEHLGESYFLVTLDRFIKPSKQF